MAVEDTEYVQVASLSDLEDEGRQVVSSDGRPIALFHHEGEVYAVDNRCPHMGFPLTRGTVEDGILTCHWHHARFELEEGDTFDLFADDVQTFPTEIKEGEVYLDPDPEPDVPPTTRRRNRLADGLQENISLVMAKSVIGLDEEGEGFYTPLETAINFGTRYRAMGWGRGLTTLGCMANLHGHVGGRDKRRAMFMGVREVADDSVGEPPRFQQYAFDNQDLSKSRLKSWFRNTCEVRDTDGAERCLLTAIDSLPPEDIAEIVFAAATDHRYMNAGHTLDFINTAFETTKHLGWEEHADAALASTVAQITDATRSEELSSWRQPVDIASLCADANDLLPDLVTAGEGKEWERPEGFVETLLSEDAEAIIDALTDAIKGGATTSQLADAVARAATRRVLWFATNNEFNDWNTVHHTFTYANAVHRATRKTDATELYRACFDGAMSVYLDRFLNSPRAPVPDPGSSDRDPADVRADLLDAFDEQGQVNQAATLVSEHFDADGDPDDLKRTLGRGLLREDANFHTLQNVEGAFGRFEVVDDEAEQRTALMACARYMAAHFPTRRSAEQTFSIATRLHRGERLHEVE
ncbi:Rieske (2Fe-2S) protein [Halococcus saccharolyticus]|uniref:Ferredoxin domain-containing protein n=1 Tax=Halococcus saccharolyticus DSM 5350 TaxID=1227455 RepID=M0MC00_9EURY|nr:Rieske (2Fe-2S) protein [Halococcus saccharolyticus]EMA43271.1 ferredoxin domain-containing protein [Halococcus saccharolyticus DSM 5350]